MPRSGSGEPGGPPSGIDLLCMPPDRPVIERIGEPLPEGVEFCVLAGNPCILFADWDYAEDWSGTFVRVIQPDLLSTARRIAASEFWASVRRVQADSRGALGELARSE